jgi:hypothetical protein
LKATLANPHVRITNSVFFTPRRPFADAIICEILGLSVFNGVQNEIRDDFRLVALGVIGRRAAAGWISHPVLGEIRVSHLYVAARTRLHYDFGQSVRPAHREDQGSRVS